MSTRNQAFIPGLIVFAALVVFLSAILWLSGSPLFSGRENRFFIEFENMAGLGDQAPVYMRGYQVGETRDVEFSDSNVRVTIQVEKRYRIPIDSRFEITSLNLIGEKAVSILPGISPESLAPGAVVQGLNRDLMSLAAGLIDSAREQLERGNIETVVRKASESFDNMMALVGKLNSKVDRLDIALYNRGAGEIEAVARELQVFARNAGRDAGALTRAGEEGLERFQETLEEVDAALGRLTILSGEIRQVTAGLRRGRGTAGALLQDREFFDRLNRTLDELNAFLADIKQNPKKYVKFSIF